jgi:para-aminobenzoate synthetase component 1
MTAPLVHELIPSPDPVRACEALDGLPYRLLLDSASSGTRLGRYSFLAADPVAIVRSKRSRTEWWPGEGACTLIDGGPLDAVRRWLAPFSTMPVEGLPPFQGGAAGYIGYEFGRTLETMPESQYDDLALPDVVLGLYDWVIAWDHAANRAWLLSTGIPETDVVARRARAAVRRDAILARLNRRPQPSGAPEGAPHVRSLRSVAASLWPAPPEPAPSYLVDEPRLIHTPDLRSSFTRAAYIDSVTAVREYIFAGDIFQANLSQRFEAPLTESPWSLYTRLRTRNPAPFAAFLDFPEATVISASPERFLRVAPDGWVETRPIKGTRPRGVGPEHDAHLGRELAESEKDQAENLMVVDLMRNDLSRVCRPGSVRVSELFALEHYATVHHLVSTVVGRLEPGRDAFDLLLAAFPGGSVTGAPKIRAMEIIAALEPSERGVYCGCIGYASVTGALDTSIAIRTAVVRGGRVTFSAGGGITAASDSTQEYRETLDKARGMIDALTASHGTGARQS